MRIRKALATAAVLAAAIGPVLAAQTANAGVNWPPPHGYKCGAFGTGPTLGAARQAADEDMIGNVTVGQWIVTDGQYADGSYWVQIEADCIATN